MPEPNLELALLLAHADDGKPVVSDSLVPTNAAGMTDPQDERPSRKLRDSAADPNDLVQQRYGVIAPLGPRGDRLLEVVAPLLRARQNQQGGVPLSIERVAGNFDNFAARDFRSKILQKNSPKYWLVLGDLHEVSLETTLALGSSAFVGRLGFTKDEEYESYVAKVLRYEREPFRSASGQTVLCSVRDGSKATALSHRAFMVPLEDVALQERDLGRLNTSSVSLLEATKFADLNSVFQTDEPTVLFSSSHGAGPPRGGYTSEEQQRRLSGAMCFGQEVVTSDVASRGRFLPGGIWFYLACYGAGTPSRSVFTAWLQHLVDQREVTQDVAAQALLGLPIAGTAPFVAALPKAALANPDGPLAIIGHMDLAWSSAFTDPGAPIDRHTMRFHYALRALVEGRRIGIAHGEVARFFLDTSLDLSDMYDDEAQGRVLVNDAARGIRKAHLWMRRHDLGNYVLLGDPAVRLPIASNRVTYVEPGGGVDVSAMEEAALAVLGRGERPQIVAKRMGLSAQDVANWANEYAAAGRTRLGQIKER